jgi:hypothetical protein
MDRDEVREGE